MFFDSLRNSSLQSLLAARNCNEFAVSVKETIDQIKRVLKNWKDLVGDYLPESEKKNTVNEVEALVEIGNHLIDDVYICECNHRNHCIKVIEAVVGLDKSMRADPARNLMSTLAASKAVQREADAKVAEMKDVQWKVENYKRIVGLKCLEMLQHIVETLKFRDEDDSI